MSCLKRLNFIGFLNHCQNLKFLSGRPLTLRLHSSTANSSDPYVYDHHETYNSDVVSAAEEKITKEVLFKVNSQIKDKSHSRLFAVIQLGECKFKVTTEDVIALNTYFPANVGEKIRLEKVLAVGSTDFTLLGRPVLSKDLLRIEATVIEKTFIVPRPLYRHGLHYRRLHFNYYPPASEEGIFGFGKNL